MTDPSRRLAYEILKSIDSEGAYSNILLNRKLAAAPEADPALVRRLVHGVLKNQTLLDYNIALFLRRPGLKKKARLLLRLGFYQLALCEGIPDHAAVDTAVALAKETAPGSEGFLNAVLRSFIRSGKQLTYPSCEETEGEALIQALALRYSCQPWIVRLWMTSYGRPRAEALLKASLEEAPLHLRPNPLKGAADRAFDLSCGIAGSEDYRRGRFSVQDASSAKAIAVLDPKPGERILDVCAAPGGKTCAMAERMEDQGSILACDLHEGKLALVEREASRLGITIVSTCVRDGSASPPEEELERYDAVLCDVPCSGLGVLRRKPEIKHRLREEDAAALPSLQSAILYSAGRCVKPGGRLMYSTCTVNPAENEGVTGAFLREGAFEKIEERQIFTGEDIDGSRGDGFYYCLMRKKTL